MISAVIAHVMIAKILSKCSLANLSAFSTIEDEITHIKYDVSRYTWTLHSYGYTDTTSNSPHEFIERLNVCIRKKLNNRRIKYLATR